MVDKYPNPYFKVKQCPVCGIEYTPEAPSQKYCSSGCRGRNAYYVRNYGITEEQYIQMKQDRDYKCDICKGKGFIIGKNNHTEKLAVDHCHTTGKVRGLLCHNCNRALGQLKDDTAILQRAIDYLNTANGNEPERTE